MIISYHIHLNDDANPKILPERLKDDEKDFISMCLQERVTSRLGANGGSEVMAHPYFTNMDWTINYEKPGYFVDKKRLQEKKEEEEEAQSSIEGAELISPHPIPADILADFRKVCKEAELKHLSETMKVSLPHILVHISVHIYAFKYGKITPKSSICWGFISFDAIMIATTNLSIIQFLTRSFLWEGWFGETELRFLGHDINRLTGIR